MNRIALKPCPFCGNDSPEIFQSGGYWKIKCKWGCQVAISGYPYKQDALVAWNRRPTNKPDTTEKSEINSVDDWGEI